MIPPSEDSTGLEGVAFRALGKLSVGVVVTRAGSVVYCNDAFASMTALKPEDTLGKPHPFLDGPCASDATVEPLLEHLESPAPSGTVRVVYERLDGLPAWNEVQLCRETDHVTWMHRDVTQQIGTDELWRRYEFLVDSSQQFMALVNRNHAYELVNHSFAAAFETSPDDVNGSSAATLWGRSMFSTVVAPHLKTCFKGKQVRIQHWVELPVGGRRYLDMIYTPYKNQDERVDHAVFVAWDVTREKVATDAVQDANRQLGERVDERTAELRDTMQELEAFNYTIAHDLRSPLRVLKSFAQMLADGTGGDLSHSGSYYVSMISQGVAEMQRMIDSLLDFSRLSRKPIAMTRCDLDAVLADAQRTASLGSEAVIRVEPLPDCQGDPALLKQVFVNLLHNAEKFIGEEEEPRIDVYTEAGKPDQVRICVRDNGMGFHMTHAETIFAPFKQMNDHSDAAGSGLGLAIVRRIVERHGGRVWAVAEEGVGANFYVELRACDENQDMPAEFVNSEGESP